MPSRGIGRRSYFLQEVMLYRADRIETVADIMEEFSNMTIRITGTGSALPEKIVTNFDLQELVETSDEWIQKRTGIAQRRVSTGETVSTLAAKACKRALEMAGKKSRRGGHDTGCDLFAGAAAAMLCLSGAGFDRRGRRGGV